MFYVSVFGAVLMLMALPFYVILISLIWRIPLLVVGLIELVWRWGRWFFWERRT